MSFSAAEYQKHHNLEGAPDPFPSLAEEPTVKASKSGTGKKELDTESEIAFPSLAPSAPSAAAPVKSGWGAGPRIKPAVAKTPVFTDSLTLTAVDTNSSGRDGKPATMGEVLKQIMSKFKVKVEASGNAKANQTTFYIKAESEKELEKAKRSLLSLLSPSVSIVINAPASAIPTIIGTKGATLKQIRDQTGVKVDIPPRNTLAVPEGQSGTASPAPKDEDDDEEPTIPVTISGPQPMVQEAQALLNQIISTKISKSTQRVRDIPAHILPFVQTKRASFEAVAKDDPVNLTLNAREREISVSGNRETVTQVVETIKATIEKFKSEITSVKISLPKRQHRLLVGKPADEIMAENKCSIVVSSPEDIGDEVTVWGLSTNLPGALGAVMMKANSQHIHEFPLPGPIALSRQYLGYITRIGYPKTLSTAHPGVSIYTPHPNLADKLSTLNIDIVGDKPLVDTVVRKFSELIGKLIGGTKDVQIDWLLHRVVQGKNAKKLKQFHEQHNVSVFFPSETSEKNEVLLVYDPLSPNASLSPDEKKKHLEDVAKELSKMAKDAGDVKSEQITVEKKWHDAVLGKNSTTLNAIIGEDNALSIKVGAEAEDAISIRGASADVDRAVKEILQIVEDAQNEQIVNSYSTEFDVEREYVGRIVGAQGAGINKLRDQLGVRVDVSDDHDEKDKEVTVRKKKSTTHQKSKVKITGRKENVEEAKKRILAQIERLADETQEVLKIPAQYHASLIGQSGKYAIRLEDKYSVKITFPRQAADNGEGKTREPLKSDEVLVKGGRKGVAQAKGELLEAVEFEKDNNNLLKFTIPARSIARVLGKGGASINQIKDDTDAQIDIDRPEGDATIANITVKGTKKAIAAAKAAIVAISEQVQEETTDSITIEQKYHRSLIGAGGQGLKELVLKCGGPTDARAQAGLIRFPRQGEASDEVRLRGEPNLVQKIKAELEKAAAVLRDRVVLGVDIPAAQHRTFIGRGGQHLNELQNRHSVQIQFPGSRSYAQVGEPINAADLGAADSGNLVKITGPKANCEKAVEELKSQIKAPVPEGPSDTVSVPLKFYHAIQQQGALSRTLRSFGVQVEHSAKPVKAPVPARPTNGHANGIASARIDEVDDAAAEAGVQWEVSTNHQDAEEGDSVWTLKARDQAGLGNAKKAIQDAIDSAGRLSHVGFLTLADRSSFPRIVGSKGSTVSRLRTESGADITVGKEDNTIVIQGSEDSIVAAKDAILRLISEKPAARGPRRHD
ncbi:hypothetical protein BDV98DRAFT_592135 [Pterulicium gracile]|uniref:K Homology domain-containing protein n=1 Tax=Pterulicium gracile TaxID=1884261 RepID=A0A5C3QKH9_9AGAR|nr:hypothetical protein BDV98DRAFT_592135 [Pterula gracilis]